MRWIKQILRNWVNRTGGELAPINLSDKRPSRFVKKTQTAPIPIDDEGLRSQPIRLKVYAAEGGLIVETSIYDNKHGSSKCSLHIVTHDQELGEALSKILIMEKLRG